MITFLSAVIATFVTIPILALWISYAIVYKITSNKKRSFQGMIDFSTIFFIFAVGSLCYVIWGQAFFGPFILLIIVIAMIFVVLQWKLNEEIHLVKLIKGTWRFSFLLFFTGYIGLLIFGLIHRLISIY